MGQESTKKASLWALICLTFLPPTLWATQTVQLEAAAESRAGIRTQAVELRTFGDQIRVVGQTVRSPGSTVTVKALLEGRVVKVHVAPGDAVRRGSPLVTLHSHQLDQLKGEYLRLREALKLAENRVKAGEQLLALEGISRLDLEQRQQNALAARLDLAAVKSELEHLGLQLKAADAPLEDASWHPELILRAPSDGVVLDLDVETHGWVEPYQPLLVIGDPNRLELEIQLPPDRAGRAMPGDQVDFIPVGQPNQRGLARIITRVPRVDPMTRTVTLRAEIIEGPDRTLPGVFIEGTLTAGATALATSIPEASVIRIGSEDRVFVQTAKHTYEARSVHLGRFSEGHYEVLDGLVPGDQVAVEGVFLLKSTLLRLAAEGE